jgi:hypothetical protein
MFPSARSVFIEADHLSIMWLLLACFIQSAENALTLSLT